jgi:hypothetical protein
MRRLFHAGVLLLVVFEIAHVYFVMPLPGSQRLPSLELAYWLHAWRWAFRLAAALLVAAGLAAAWRAGPWPRRIAVALLLLAAGVAYATNVTMAADRIFVAPASLRMAPASGNAVALERLVVGVELNGEARAYPLQFIGYHHQVRDTVGGRPVLVSYCTVCRSGRVFDPRVDGRAETFRLVGMDHWNAMFEDATTGTWWRQATGEAVAGPRAGATLAEIPSRQMTLAAWLALHPATLVMQADSAVLDRYPKNFDFESGASRNALTGTDAVSWRDKAWVVGIALGGESKAYDWNRLRRECVINDVLGGVPIVLALAPDSTSFVAFRRPAADLRLELRGDSLVAGGRSYGLLSGRGPSGALAPVTAYQEFWHSWRTFHPGTRTY